MRNNKPKDLQPEEWLKRAGEDQDAAAALLESGKVSGSMIAFHLQQAAEKQLKAFLVAKTGEYPKIHLLDALWEKCYSLDSSFDTIKFDVIELEPFYIPGRYPGDYPEIDLDEAKRLTDIALKIWNFIRDKLR